MPEPRNIMALDLATTMGFAIGRSDRPTPRFGSKVLGGKKDKPEVIGANFMLWFADQTRLEKFDEIHVERAMHPSAAARIGTNPETALILFGMVFMAISFAKARNIAVVETVDAQKVKGFFTGKSKFSDEFDPSSQKIIKSREVGKRATINRCWQLGLEVQDDNAADACALWFHAAAKHNPAILTKTTALFAGSEA